LTASRIQEYNWPKYKKHFELRGLKKKDMRLMSPDPPPSQDEILRILKPFPIDPLKIYLSSFCSKDGISYGLIRTLETEVLTKIKRSIGPCLKNILKNI